MKKYFVLAGIDKQCHKYIFRGIENTEKSKKLREIDKPLSYTIVRGHALDLPLNIGLACDQVVLQQQQPTLV